MSCSTKKEAVQLGRALAKQLGKMWQPRIWENMGWHYVAQTEDKLINVYPTSHFTKTGRKIVEYHCMIGLDGCMRADLAPTLTMWSTDPKRAVTQAVAAYNEKWLDLKSDQEAIMATAARAILQFI
jgi:hypothetical protein